MKKYVQTLTERLNEKNKVEEVKVNESDENNNEEVLSPEYSLWVIEMLEDWRETWNEEYSDYEEEDKAEAEEGYFQISQLIERYKNSNCSSEDYENILFHLWQKSQG